MTAQLPNSGTRPAEELEELRRIWRIPRGIRVLQEYNNTVIGVFYVGTAFLFFLLAGVLGLVMRAQLAVPENDLVTPALYNQLFTMHGTVMMFLFAVPAVEAMGILLLPNMLGARDMPFPRLSTYAYWAYAVGGLVFFSSLFMGLAPTGGWFMNPPLTLGEYSPGINEDFWLLGIGFIEISAIAGAIELIVGILRTRAPGMTLARMPVLAWVMLVFALMVVFAFPAVILATTLLELERAFQWPFFSAAKGGDALLWQHLFWFFGHPEVYIIFLPAAGMVSMMTPTMAQSPLVAYRLVVLAVVATALLSFGLWVHHMFATGIPRLSLAFFEAASMAVAVPAGIQVFAWIATLASGRVKVTTPTLFILGFLFTFVLGGLTGVMLAAVPFDWQAHDTYFVVAHLHYVLIGGMVFPLLAAFYYWTPFISRNALSERLGRWVFGLTFAGFNVAFFPMHITGLAGMPRRVHTYAAGYGWDALNMVSTIGAATFALGILLLVIDFARRFRMASEDNAGNVWDAGTLEWLPSGSYGVRSIPIVASREPLWDQPNLARDVEEGRYYLPNAPTGCRETLVTNPLDGTPQYLLRMPPMGWSPFIASISTAAFFLLLTGKFVWPAIACGVVAIGAIARWGWDLDPAPLAAPVDVGGGLLLPAYMSGPRSHSWWAVVVLMLVCGSLYACAVFSYLYLWIVAPHAWPVPGAMPAAGYPLAAATLFAASSACIGIAHRCLAARRMGGMIAGIVAGFALFAAGFGLEFVAQRAESPTKSGYFAMVYLFASFDAFFAAVLLALAAFTVARALRGHVDPMRRVTFDNMRLLWHYSVGQALVGIVLVHGFPRIAS